MNVMRKVMKSGAGKVVKSKDDPEDLSSCSEVEDPEDDEEEEEEEGEDSKVGREKSQQSIHLWTFF